MSREIKFRVWDRATNKMLFKDFHLLGEVMVFSLISQWLKEYPIEGRGSLRRYGDLVFQQATGIKDKNGKDIYEGDLIDFELREGYNSDLTIVKNVEVFYREEDAGYVAGRLKNGRGMEYSYDLRAGLDELSVVGHIFEITSYETKDI